MKVVIAAAVVLLAAPAVHAQSEEQLKDYFEGKTVVVKIDMPATQTGIDVFADARRPINFDEYSARLKSTGIAIRSGERVMITKIKLKEKLIEFHLGGGGYGTAGDDTSTSVYVPSAAKTSREKELERLVRLESDAGRKRRLQNELDDLKKEREREDQRNKAASAAAGEEKRRRIAEQRLHSGSRFNLRYQNGIPPGVTPGGIMAALVEYVEFPFNDKVVRPARPDPEPSPSDLRRTMAGTAGVYKGMTWQAAEDALGTPEHTSDRMEGKLKVTTAVFSRGDQRVEADFVEGVLIKYSISSK